MTYKTLLRKLKKLVLYQKKFSVLTAQQLQQSSI